MLITLKTGGEQASPAARLPSIKVSIFIVWPNKICNTANFCRRYLNLRIPRILRPVFYGEDIRVKRKKHF